MVNSDLKAEKECGVLALVIALNGEVWRLGVANVS